LDGAESVVSLEEEDESPVVSVVLSSDFPLQDESNTAMLISRKIQVNKILIFCCKNMNHNI
jgi:hypothetical protein